MRGLLTVMLTAALGLAIAAPAPAQQQSGLVNVNVSDNTVLVPVAVAANVCDVTVGVLVSNLRDTGSTTCNALATSGATVTPGQGGGVNVNLENNVVQIPIAAAANICDVDVFVLASEILLNDATSCRARAGASGIA